MAAFADLNILYLPEKEALQKLVEAAAHQSNGKATVSTNSRAVLLYGEARKTASGVVYTVKKPQTPEEKDDDAPLSKKAKKDL